MKENNFNNYILAWNIIHYILKNGTVNLLFMLNKTTTQMHQQCIFLTFEKKIQKFE